MKKIFTFLTVVGSIYSFAQNGSGNLHVINDNANHSLDLYFTLFTIVPATCSTSIQGISSGLPLPAGGMADYTTFAAAASTATPPNPSILGTLADRMLVQLEFQALCKQHLVGIT